MRLFYLLLLLLVVAVSLDATTIINNEIGRNISVAIVLSILFIAYCSYDAYKNKHRDEDDEVPEKIRIKVPKYSNFYGVVKPLITLSDDRFDRRFDIFANQNKYFSIDIDKFIKLLENEKILDNIASAESKEENILACSPLLECIKTRNISDFKFYYNRDIRKFQLIIPLTLVKVGRYKKTPDKLIGDYSSVAALMFNDWVYRLKNPDKFAYITTIFKKNDELLKKISFRKLKIELNRLTIVSNKEVSMEDKIKVLWELAYSRDVSYDCIPLSKFKLNFGNDALYCDDLKLAFSTFEDGVFKSVKYYRDDLKLKPFEDDLKLT